MWLELQKTPPFFLLFRKRQRYHILLTNYIKIWELYYFEEELIDRLKDSNFGLEMDRNELLDKGLQMLQSPSKLKNIKISIEGQKLTASMIMSYGFNLKFVATLEEGSPELFFKEITQPALRTIQDLKFSENELRKVLIKKDDEIEEYKSFGGKIRYTAIPPYNDEMHMKKHCLYNVNFGDATVPTSILERVVNILPQNQVIKEEPIDSKVSVKLEPISQETTSPNVTCTKNKNKKEHVKTELPARKRKLNL